MYGSSFRGREQCFQFCAKLDGCELIPAGEFKHEHHRNKGRGRSREVFRLVHVQGTPGKRRTGRAAAPGSPHTGTLHFPFCTPESLEEAASVKLCSYYCSWYMLPPCNLTLALSCWIIDLDHVLSFDTVSTVKSNESLLMREIQYNLPSHRAK